MALNFNLRYTPDVIAPSASYPYGSFKNETTPGALDGTPVEKDWADDLGGILQKLLDYAALIPSGNPDTVLVSQYFEALMKTFEPTLSFVDNGTGTPDAIKILSVGSKPPGYTDNQIIVFKAADTNAGAATIQIDTLAAKSIVNSIGSALGAGDITAGSYVLAIFNLTADRFELLIETSSTSLNRGVIDGLWIENDAGDLLNDIKINIGNARSDENNFNMVLPAPLIKKIDADWVEGNNAGGFPSGLTLLIDTWYPVFLIGKPDGQTDAGYDIALNAVNLLADATDYLYYRRVGSVLTDGSGNIIRFTQCGNEFLWYSPPEDFSGSILSVGSTISLSTPDLIKCISICNVNIPTANSNDVYLTALDQNNQAVNSTAGLISLRSNGDHRNAVGDFYTRTNTGSSIRIRANATTSADIATMGYIDFRGKE